MLCPALAPFTNSAVSSEPYMSSTSMASSSAAWAAASSAPRKGAHFSIISAAEPSATKNFVG